MSAASLRFGALLAILCAVLPFLSATRELPDIELRTRPNHARRAVRLDASAPVRQAFRANVDGLARIDVALSGSDGQPAGGRVELTLRDDAGVELRSAHVVLRGLAAPFEFVTFAFEPIEDSMGRRVSFELRPAMDGATIPVTPWMRARRLPGVRAPRGPVPYEGTAAEGTFESRWADLSAVAIAFKTLAPGSVRLELLGPGDDAPLRVVEHTVSARQRGGSVLLAFEPIERSRRRTYRWRVEVPEGTVLLGGPNMPAVTQYHGPIRTDERLFGALGTGWPDGAADLLFRAYGEDAPFALLLHRAGARVGLAFGLWVGAVVLLVGTMRTARRRSTPTSPRSPGTSAASGGGSTRS